MKGILFSNNILNMFEIFFGLKESVKTTIIWAVVYVSLTVVKMLFLIVINIMNKTKIFWFYICLLYTSDAADE